VPNLALPVQTSGAGRRNQDAVPNLALPVQTSGAGRRNQDAVPNLALPVQTSGAGRRNQDAVTNPDREMVPLPGATTQQWEPLQADGEDEAKTMPALAVPDEIRALRVRVAEMAKRKKAESAATHGITTELVDSLDLRSPRPSVSKRPSERRTTLEETLSVPGQIIDTAEDEEGAETVVTTDPPEHVEKASLRRASAELNRNVPGPGKRRLLFALISLSLAALMLGLLIVFDLVKWP
jgi:hypothetical protein